MTRRRFQITKEGIFPVPSSSRIHHQPPFGHRSLSQRHFRGRFSTPVLIGCVLDAYLRVLFSSASAKTHRYPGSKPFRAVRLVTTDDGEPLPLYHNTIPL